MPSEDHAQGPLHSSCCGFMLEPSCPERSPLYSPLCLPV